MFIIREGRPDDVPGLAALRATWTAEQDATPMDDPAFDAAYSRLDGCQPPQVLWWPTADGELVGMLNLLVFERMP